MRTSEMFKNKTVLSFEVVPPKKTAPLDSVFSTVETLKGINPDFISVTYSPGGIKDHADPFEIASAIKNEHGVETVVHLPCIHLAKDEVLKILNNCKKIGIENILALRGDIAPGCVLKNNFKYASDLVSFIKENGDFNIVAACYPEGHYQSPSIVDDIRHLKYKVDMGADHLITQLFFENDRFYRFRERTSIAGINVPIEAGIMAAVNKKQVEQILSLCKMELPKKFQAIMDKYENNPRALKDAGIAYAVDQIVDLVTHGVDGIHLYIMNNIDVAFRIYDAIKSLLDA
jgi:methylenetetrahydrofolate reductase (NADPH)